MTEAKEWLQVLEGDSVDRFLDVFTLGQAQRQQIEKQTGADFSRIPQSKQQVLDDLEQIWRHHGFLTPAETRVALVDRYLPDAHPEVRGFIRDIELSRNTLDPVTGYLGRDHAYLASGLAHLYALRTAMPMTMAEIDFSNMGGTNEYFRKLLAEEEGLTPEEIDAASAAGLTDHAVAVLSQGIVSDMAKLYPEERIVAIRAGGDELRIFVTGIADDGAYEHLADYLHANIERRVAAMGLQDHPHLKDPTDPRRCGFGAALALQDMREIHCPGTLVQELDAKISATKLQLGMLRIGMIDRDALGAEVEQDIHAGRTLVPRGLSIDHIVDLAVAEAQRQAEKIAEKLQDMNPVHNSALKGGLEGFLDYVAARMASVPSYQVACTDLPEALDRQSLGGANRPRGVKPSDSLERRYMALALRHFEEAGVTPTPQETYFVRTSVSGLVTGVSLSRLLTPAGMIRMVNNAAEDAQDFRASVDKTDPEVQAALQRAGLRDIAQIRPQMLAISVHNVAGLNSALGHYNADIVLEYIAHHVVTEAVHAAGLPREARNNFSLAHHGSGHFSLLLPAGGTDAKEGLWFSPQYALHKVRSEIKQRIKALNNTDIADFLTQHGGYVDQDVRRYLDRAGLGVFSDVPDTKDRVYQLGDASVRGGLPGLHAVIAGAVVKDELAAVPDGGEKFVSVLMTRVDAMMDQSRAALLQSMRGGTVPYTFGDLPGNPFYAAFNNSAGTSAGTPPANKPAVEAGDPKPKRQGPRI